MKTTDYSLRPPAARLRPLCLSGTLLLWGWLGPTSAQAAGQVPFRLASFAAPDTVPAHAVAPALHRNILKLNPLSLALGQLSLFYERAVTSQVAVAAGFGSGGSTYSFGRTLAQGGVVYRRATIEVRRYWYNRAPQGWYAGPYLRVAQLRESHFVADPPTQHAAGTWQTHQALIWMPGVLLGHQFLTKRFSLDGFVGLQAQVKPAAFKVSNQLGEAMTGAVALRAGLTVGIPFH